VVCQLILTGVLLAAGAACRPRASAPPPLEELAAFDTTGWAHDVRLENGTILVADRQGGVAAFSRNPLRLLSRIKPVADVISLAPNSGRLLLASRFEGIVLADSAGTALGRHSNGDIANAVAQRRDLAYTAYGQHGLVIARIMDSRLELVSELPTPGWSHDVKLDGNRALLADWDYGLRVVDVGDPTRPVEIGRLPTAATAICVAPGADELTPMAAVAEGHAGVTLAAFDGNGQPRSVGRNTLGLRASDPHHPETGGWAHSIAWSGNYLFVANWKRGLAVLDAADRPNLRTLAEIETPGTALGVVAEAQPDGSHLVFLTDGETGLRLYRFNPRR
jgi:hypothetical protein